VYLIYVILLEMIGIRTVDQMISKKPRCKFHMVPLKNLLISRRLKREDINTAAILVLT